MFDIIPKKYITDVDNLIKECFNRNIIVLDEDSESDNITGKLIENLEICNGKTKFVIPDITEEFLKSNGNIPSNKSTVLIHMGKNSIFGAY